MGISRNRLGIQISRLYFTRIFATAVINLYRIIVPVPFTPKFPLFRLTNLESAVPLCLT